MNFNSIVNEPNIVQAQVNGINVIPEQGMAD
jgi:hypothetical protein